MPSPTDSTIQLSTVATIARSRRDREAVVEERVDGRPGMPRAGPSVGSDDAIMALAHDGRPVLASVTGAVVCGVVDGVDHELEVREFPLRLGGMPTRFPWLARM